MDEQPVSEEEIEDHEEALRYLQGVMEQSRDNVVRGIIRAKDEFGMTFREIGSVMGIAHSWAFRMYKRGKKRGL